MKNIKILLFILTAALFFTACQKEETSHLWNIKGTIEMLDGEIPEIKNPVGNVKVYLLDLESSIDTLTGWFNPENVLDSTFTNTSGFYGFNNVEPLNYWIYPEDTSQQCNFSVAAKSDPIWILTNSTKSDFEINFTSPSPVAENGDDSFVFEFNITKAADFSFTGTSDSWSGETKSKTNLVIKIKRETSAFQGWGMSDWTIVEKWSEPYFSVVDSREIDGVGFLKLSAYRDASGMLYRYKDKFIINFSYEYSHFYEDSYGEQYWFSDGTKWMHSVTNITGYNFQYHQRNNIKLHKDRIEVLKN